MYFYKVPAAAGITSAPAPPFRNAADVISLFSDAYSNVAGTDWFPNWQQTTIVSDTIIQGDNTKKYENLNYQGVQFAASVDASSMQKLHVDIWTPNCTAFDVFLINTTPSLVQQKVTLNPTANGWNSYDINLSDYTTIALNNIGQIKLEGTPFGTSKVYMDNMYFWRSGGLPVVMNGFNVQKMGAKSKLTWKTSSEYNNKGFQIERSLNGRDWQSIGFVQGAGNSQTEKQYAQMDYTPAKGLNYYRIKQIDLDNQFKYSSVLTLNFAEAGSFAVYPNPARNQATISLPSLENNQATLQILSLDGRVVKVLSLTQSNLNVNLSDLNKGVYLIRLSAEGQHATQKLIVE